MDEKEKKLLETIKDYLSEGEKYRAKKFIFKNEDNGTYEQFLKKYPLYSWYGKSEFYNKD